MDSKLDRIIIRDLLVRGIIGVNADERQNRQDILVNVSLGVDTRSAALSDDIKDTINYSQVARAVVRHIEESQPLLVERLAADLVRLCFEFDRRIQAVELSVEKTRALRFGRSVGVAVYRERREVLPDA